MSQYKPSFRILLVGHPSEQMGKMQSYLERGGYQTILTDYGEAERCFIKTQPSATVIETGDAYSESLTVCRHLRLHGGTTLPILIVTPDESLIQSQGSLGHYADDYLLEPIDSGTLLLRLSVLLKRKQAQAGGVETDDESFHTATDVDPFLRLTEAARAAMASGRSGAIALIGAEPLNDLPAEENAFAQGSGERQAAQQRLALEHLTDFLASRLKLNGSSALAPYGSFSLFTYQPHSTAMVLADRLSAWREDYLALGQGDFVAGTASFPEDATSLLDLIALADEALMQARKQRRITRYRPIPPTSSARHQRRLLIVDDSPEQVEMLNLLVTQEGYETLRAYNGEQALDLLSKQQPDLLLLDLVMPRLDGFAVMRRLRDRNGGRLQPPVIMITANDCEESVLRGFELGARDYIIKPYHPRELLSRIHSILELPTAASRQ
jgi:DNA-binding response OmpR family regulator